MIIVGIIKPMSVLRFKAIPLDILGRALDHAPNHVFCISTDFFYFSRNQFFNPVLCVAAEPVPVLEQFRSRPAFCL